MAELLKSKKIVLHIVLLLVCLISGCSKPPFDVKKADIIVYHSSKESALFRDSLILTSDSKETQLIVDWVNDSDAIWHSSPVTFMPGYWFEIEEYRFNYLNNTMVVNFVDEQGDGHQVVREVNDSSFDFIPRRFETK